MARYIDAEEFLDLFYVAAFKQDKLFVKTVEMVVDDTPTADVVEVKHGKWEINKEDIEWGNSLKRRYCSNCGASPFFDKEEYEFILTDYCSECGAKMDGGNAE